MCDGSPLDHLKEPHLDLQARLQMEPQSLELIVAARRAAITCPLAWSQNARYWWSASLLASFQCAQQKSVQALCQSP